MARSHQPPPKRPEAPHRSESDQRLDTLLRAAIIALAVLAIYSPTFHGDWHWDDDQLLTKNLSVQHRVSPDPAVPPNHLATLAKLWFHPSGADFFPLSYTALWLQWPLYGLTSTGYHATTIGLHILGSLLLWALLARMRIPGAWLAGLLFAVHPVCVESVAWVSETKNTLSLPLFLTSCLCWVAQDDESNGDRRRWLYGFSILFFLLAMLAKTSMVALPVVLLLHAWWKRGRVTRQDLVLTAPFFSISLLLGVITCVYQWTGAIGDEKIPVGGIASRLATAGMAILFYLKQILVPLGLLPIYPRWEVDPPKAWQFLAWPVIVAGVALFWHSRGSAERPGWGRHAGFAFGFFLLMVAPVLGFVTISYMRITWVADHFIYLPMVSIVALGAALAARAFDHAAESGRRALVSLGVVTVATFGALAFLYANVWVNEDLLWTHTLGLNHDAWQAHNRLGARKFGRGDVEGAHYHFTQSTRLRPDLCETHNNLGSVLSAKGRLDEAIREFTTACDICPKVPLMHQNLANALVQARRFPEAVEKYRYLITKEPDNPVLINNYAVVLYHNGEREAAVRQFRRALELRPDMKDAREGLAVALGEKPPTQPPPGPQQAAPQQTAPAESAAPPQAPNPRPPAQPGQSTLGPAVLVPPAPGSSFDPLGLQAK